MTTAEAVRIAELVSALDLRTWDETRVMHWAGILQRGAEAAKLPGDLLLLTCEELLREMDACEISPAKLLKRAKSSPPKAWLVARERLTLDGPRDLYFSQPRYYPDGCEPGTTRRERAAMDRSYANWKNSATAEAMTVAQRKLPKIRTTKRPMTQARAIPVANAIQALQDSEPFE